MFNILWKHSGHLVVGKVLGGLVEVKIDVYVPHPTKGNAYQIRILGLRSEKVGTKLWLPDIDAAMQAAVDRLIQLKDGHSTPIGSPDA